LLDSIALVHLGVVSGRVSARAVYASDDVR
jgi:hypothetical protein